MENRVIRLEETLAMQERTIEQLSDVIAAQQTELEELRKQMKLLGERFKGEASGGGGPEGEEPPPPHYL